MDAQAREIAIAFGLQSPELSVVHDGLIHTTFKAVDTHQALVLQRINTHVFSDPHKIISNYITLYRYLRQGSLQIPAPVTSPSGEYLCYDSAGNPWRATRLVIGAYTEIHPTLPHQAMQAAHCFATFTQALAGLDPASLDIIIPRFHDLRWRYEQFLIAIEKADQQRRLQANELIHSFQERNYLVKFYDRITQQPEFRLRVMHHDCKMSNILLDEKTALPICPIDWDTLMPGYFFSDLGDLVRSLAGSHTEAATFTHDLHIRKEFYNALLNGYLEGMGQAFTSSEKQFIHHAGPLMIYMQGLRFLTDYLIGDVYYKTTYPQQNFDRARNQHALLVCLEIFLRQEWDYTLDA